MEKLRDHVLDLRPIGVVSLAIAAIWSTSIASGTWKSVRAKPEAQTIRVTGSAKKRIVADLAQWEATLEARATDRTAAYKQLHDQTQKAIEFLKTEGFKPDEIRPESASFEEEFDTIQETKVVPGTTVPATTEKKVFKDYVTRQAITIKSSNIALVDRASREITSLLEQGVSITSQNPEYFYTHLGELKVEMLAAAGKDARARADNILESAGGATIRKLITADMGIININPANSTDTSEEGNNDTTSIEKDIITIVHAEFELE
jgi:hypothetical protein